MQPAADVMAKALAEVKITAGVAAGVERAGAPISDRTRSAAAGRTGQGTVALA